MDRSGTPPRFGAVITAMVTPFADDGALDVDGAVRLAHWLVDHGTDGLVITGTTGEGPVLTDDEKIELWRAVAEAVTIPVIAGAGTNDTAHSISMAKAATDAGVDAVLAVTPYYNRPSQAGLYEHFAAVAAATPLPVMLYDIPIRSGRRIDPAVMVRLAGETTNVVAVKDATGDPAGAAALLAKAPRSFELYSGDDSLTLPLLAVGAVGVVSVASHWVGEEMAAMIAAFGKGDVEGARSTNEGMLPSFAFESTEEFPNPLPAKAVCRALGLDVGQCRLPMGPVPTSLDDEARALLTSLGRSPTTGVHGG